MKLHITNGDSSGDMLSASSVIKGDVFCWRDVLHDGPITALDGEQYYKERASFLWSVMNSKNPLNDIRPFEGSEADIYNGYQKRKSLLSHLNQYDEIVLWFEHDLYDQLQIAECLYHLSQESKICEKATIICIGEHNGVPYFHGLGNLSIPQMEALFPSRLPLTEEHLSQGCEVWHALVSSSPSKLNSLIHNDFSALPFMKNALRRFAQEYPSTFNGLTQLQHSILETLANPLAELPTLRSDLLIAEASGNLKPGVSAEQRYHEIMSNKELRFGRLFCNIQTLEDAPYLGDSFLMKEIETLCNAKVPYMIRRNKNKCWDLETTYLVTPEGSEALAGKRHWRDDNNYDLWRGGVHITNENLIMWDDNTATFIAK